VALSARADVHPDLLGDEALEDAVRHARGQVQEYAIADAGRVRERAEWIGGTDPAATDEIGAAVRSNPNDDRPSEKGTATMELTTTAQVSVDGVMQGPGGREEDERGRFERGGWAHFDDEASTLMDETYQRADAFLFGRRTHEIFAGSWGTWADPGDSPIWTALNTLPKYVASTTLTEPRWANTAVPLWRRRGGRRRAESQAGTQSAAARQRRPVPVAAARGIQPPPCDKVPQSMRVDIPKTRSVKLNPDP
jgi:hypothetical protein